MPRACPVVTNVSRYKSAIEKEIDATGLPRGISRCRLLTRDKRDSPRDEPVASRNLFCALSSNQRQRPRRKAVASALAGLPPASCLPPPASCLLPFRPQPLLLGGSVGNFFNLDRRPLVPSDRHRHL